MLQKYHKFHRQAPVLESLVKKVAGLKPTHEFSCEVCEIFKNTFFNRTPQVTGSGILS